MIHFPLDLHSLNEQMRGKPGMFVLTAALGNGVRIAVREASSPNEPLPECEPPVRDPEILYVGEILTNIIYR